METKTAAPPAYSQPGGGFVPPPAMGPIIKAPKFDREPVRMECPHCRNHILTRTIFLIMLLNAQKWTQSQISNMRAGPKK